MKNHNVCKWVFETERSPRFSVYLLYILSMFVERDCKQNLMVESIQLNKDNKDNNNNNI